MKGSTKVWATAVVFVAAVFVLPRFLTKHIDVPPPVEQDGDAPLVGTTNSDIQIEFQVALAALQKVLNDQIAPIRDISDTIGDPTNALTDDTIKWKLHLEQIALSRAGEALQFKIPFAGSATLHGRFGVKKRNKGLLGKFEEMLGATFSETPSFAGIVSGTLHPRFQPDWTIDPGLALHLNLSKAEADLFGKAIKVSFRGALENTLKAQVNGLTSQLNATLARNDTLRNEVSRSWTGLHLATAVYETPSVWISLKPVALGASDPIVTKDTLIMSVAATVSSAVHVGKEAPSVSISELPAMKPTQSRTGAFSIAIPIALSLDTFHNVSPKELGIPDTIEIPQGKIEIKKLFLTGEAGQLYVGADVVADLGWFKRNTATLYMTGTPRLDKEKNLLLVENLNYDVRTSNVLLASANFFLQPAVLNAMRRYAIFDLGKTKREILGRTDAEVSKLTASLPSGIELDFKVIDVGLSELVVDKGWLVAVLHAEGPATVRVQGFDGVMAEVSAPAVASTVR